MPVAALPVPAIAGALALAVVVVVQFMELHAVHSAQLGASEAAQAAERCASAASAVDNDSYVELARGSTCTDGDVLLFNASRGGFHCHAETALLALDAPCVDGYAVAADGAGEPICALLPAPITSSHVAVNVSECSDHSTLEALGGGDFGCGASSTGMLQPPLGPCSAGDAYVALGNGSLGCLAITSQPARAEFSFNVSDCPVGALFQAARDPLEGPVLSCEAVGDVYSNATIVVSALDVAGAANATGDLTVGGLTTVAGRASVGGVMAVSGAAEIKRQAGVAANVSVDGDAGVVVARIEEGGRRLIDTRVFDPAASSFVVVRAALAVPGRDPLLSNRSDATVLRSLKTSTVTAGVASLPACSSTMVAVDSGTSLDKVPYYTRDADAAEPGAWVLGPEEPYPDFPRVADSASNPGALVGWFGGIASHSLELPRLESPELINPNNLTVGAISGAVYSPPEQRVYLIPQRCGSHLLYFDLVTKSLENTTERFPDCNQNQNDIYQGGVYVPGHELIVLTIRSGDRSRNVQMLNVGAEDGEVIGTNHYSGITGDKRTWEDEWVDDGVYVPHQDMIYFTPGPGVSWFVVGNAESGREKPTVRFNVATRKLERYNHSHTGGLPEFNGATYDPDAQRIMYSTARASSVYYLDVSGDNHRMYFERGGIASFGPPVLLPDVGRVFYMGNQTADRYTDLNSSITDASSTLNYANTSDVGFHSSAGHNAYIGAIRCPIDGLLYFIPYNAANASEWRRFDPITGEYESYAAPGGLAPGAFAGAFYDPYNHCMWFYSDGLNGINWASQCVHSMYDPVEVEQYRAMPRAVQTTLERPSPSNR